MSLLIYDFEVFKKDWMVVVANMDEHRITKIHNDVDALRDFYEAHVNDIWVGFNSRHYDQYILKGILAGMDPKDINDFIIIKGEPGWKYSGVFRDYQLWNYDVMLGTDRGLKSFEGFMGNNIKETDVPFDIDRALTDEEIHQTFKYCTHDVLQTAEVFMKRKEEFDTMIYFILHFNLPMDDINKTKAQLAAKILGGNRKGQSFNDEFDFPIFDCIKLWKYRHIAEWYKKPENHDYQKKQEVMVMGVPHIYSWGGGHGAIPKFHAIGTFIMIDVAAYYPSLQEQYGIGKRVMDDWDNFLYIHHSNLEFKKKGDKKARLPFKIMDNAISGQMKQQSSALYDPMSNNTICVNGQMMLLDLIEHLEPHIKRLIQNNTDGILIELRDYERDFDTVDDIVYDWEQRTGMAMEFDTFMGEIYQKDVNNYLIIDRETGEIKCKGAYLKNLSDLDYDLPIINKAMKAYMIDGIPVEETIRGCDELREFQLVSKISSKYSHILYGDKKLNEKCIRIFASKKDDDPGVKKVKKETGRAEKLQNSPEHCFIYNDDVHGVKCPEFLDKDWYIKLTKKRLEDFGCELI